MFTVFSKISEQNLTHNIKQFFHITIARRKHVKYGNVNNIFIRSQVFTIITSSIMFIRRTPKST